MTVDVASYSSNLLIHFDDDVCSIRYYRWAKHVNPLTMDDAIWHHLTLAVCYQLACYQLAQSALRKVLH